MSDSSTKRLGVLMIQLGTPKEATVPAVRRFLREFLSDPRVIDYPAILRFLLVNLIIAPTRAPKSTKIYKDLWAAGGGSSPLLTYTTSLTEQLNAQLADDRVTVHMAMRYQGPSIDDVLDEMRRANYDKILILPLFPQYASASNGTAIQKALEVISGWWAIPELEVVSQFYAEDFYTDTLVEQAQKHDIASYDHILMSYHGIPNSHVDKIYDGDANRCSDHACEDGFDDQNAYCYKATAYETSRILARKLGIDESAYTTTFQSRLTKNWLTPFTDEVIEEHGKKGHKRLLVFSPSFVADCLETIIEVGDEYQEIFEEHGGETVQLVESCNTETTWVNGLAAYIRERHCR